MPNPNMERTMKSIARVFNIGLSLRWVDETEASYRCFCRLKRKRNGRVQPGLQNPFCLPHCPQRVPMVIRPIRRALISFSNSEIFRADRNGQNTCGMGELPLDVLVRQPNVASESVLPVSQGPGPFADSLDESCRSQVSFFPKCFCVPVFHFVIALYTSARCDGKEGERRGTLAFSEALWLQDSCYYEEMGPGCASTQIRTFCDRPIPGNHWNGAFSSGVPNLPSAWGGCSAVPENRSHAIIKITDNIIFIYR